MPKATVDHKYRYEVREWPLAKGHPNRNMGELIWWKVYDKELEQWELGSYVIKNIAEEICANKNKSAQSI
jgi:hypothetical protein